MVKSRPGAHAGSNAGLSPVADAAKRLAHWSGQTYPHRRDDPIDTLVGTILSQNTSDVNSGRAFAALKARYPDWPAVLAAPDTDLADTIRPGGLGNIKAARIQAALRAIIDAHGTLDLAFLDDLPMNEARRWLGQLPGVGLKTANCVLLFALDQPAMPVDTHVGRIARRLGWVGPTTPADAIGPVIEAGAPPETMLALHLDLIRLGRQVCKAGMPLCTICPLASVCDYARGQR